MRIKALVGLPVLPAATPALAAQRIARSSIAAQIAGALAGSGVVSYLLPRSPL